jgi:hypothetical protein
MRNIEVSAAYTVVSQCNFNGGGLSTHNQHNLC